MKRDVKISVVLSIITLMALTYSAPTYISSSPLGYNNYQNIGEETGCTPSEDFAENDMEFYYARIYALKAAEERQKEADKRFFVENERPAYSPNNVEIPRKPDRARTVVHGGSAANQMNSGVVEMPE